MSNPEVLRRADTPLLEILIENTSQYGLAMFSGWTIYGLYGEVAYGRRSLGGEKKRQYKDDLCDT